MDTDLPLGLLLLLPLVGAVFDGLLMLFVPGLRQREGLIRAVGTAMVAISFGIALYLFAGYGGEPVVVSYYRWIGGGALDISFAYRVDALSLVMTLIVTGVGALIHLYSIGYMRGDRGFWKFFAFLNLFIFAMLNLVLADDLVVLFLGWEGVGVASYLLIGFWYEDYKNSEAANKAFIVNRIGDAAFLLGLFLLFRELGGLDYDTVLGGVGVLSSTELNWAVLLLFIGATGKSAQIPLFVWLPDAMAGPTPVSALIHAATMVTSGVYLLARLSPLVLAAPAVMAAIGIVGAVTALMAATIAVTQNDIKKVLAYSTVSQLGYMFMAAGVGAFWASTFHLAMHAFFKAVLFLGAGSVIHALHEVEHEVKHRGHEGPLDSNDLRTMGGLKHYLPHTRWTYLLGALALSGVPLFSGFFSKDEILFKAFEYGYDKHAYAWFVWAVGLATAIITAVYATRSYVLAFEGRERWPLAETVKPHESPAVMTVPLWVRGVLATVGGFVGLPGVVAEGAWNWIRPWLSPSVAEAAIGAHGEGFLAVEWALIALGAAIALGGVLFAWRAYSRHGTAYDARLHSGLGRLYRWAAGRYYWDEIYERAIIAPIIGTARAGFARFDTLVIDGVVNGVARAAQRFSDRLRRIQSGVLGDYAMASELGVVLILALLLFA